MRQHYDHVNCPHCGKGICEEQRYDITTYHGSEYGEWTAVRCERCDGKFDVQEHVTREWAVKKQDEAADEL